MKKIIKQERLKVILNKTIITTSWHQTFTLIQCRRLSYYADNCTITVVSFQIPLSMFSCYFMLIAVVFSFAAANKNLCFDSQKFIAHLQPIHGRCQNEIEVLKMAHVVEHFECDFAKFHYKLCHFRQLHITTKYQGIDHAKLVALLKTSATDSQKRGLEQKLSICNKEILFANTNGWAN
uniref:Uncharacterized protein n=1 Tax=Strigamia maritima TaxID=126957 RepID=T1JGL4_STRMM